MSYYFALWGKNFLGHLGYQVKVTRNSSEALKIFQRLGYVDLVILDFYLPGRNGLQMFQDLKALDGEVRVLVASGFFPAKKVARIKEMGAAGLIYKPYRVSELKDQIRLILEGKSGF